MTTTPDSPIGILFVHGVGEQQTGETLIQCSEPLIKWLDAWVSRNGVEVTLGDTTITSHKLDEPAHAYVTVPVGAFDSEPKSPATTWLLAESHWGNTFIPPRILELVQWLVSVGPTLVLNRVYRLGFRKIRESFIGVTPPTMRRTKFQVLTWLSLFVALGIFGCRQPDIATIFMPTALFITGLIALMHALIVAVMLIVVLAAIVSIVPLPRVIGVARSVVKFITSYLGDGFVSIYSKIDQAAILSKIDNDIKWLRDSKRCEKIGIIAHSQGAYLIKKVLSKPDAHKPDLYISYGSGVSILESLDVLSTHKFHSLCISMGVILFGSLPFVITLFLHSIVLSWKQAGDPSTIWDLLFALLSIVVTITMLFVVRGAMNLLLEKLGFHNDANQDSQSDSAQNNFRQKIGRVLQGLVYDTGQEDLQGELRLDIYARMDFATEGRGASFDQSQRVRNLDSPLLDHISFWHNYDQFVPLVAAKITKTLANQNIAGKDPSSIKVAQQMLRSLWVIRSIRVDILFTTLVMHPFSIMTCALINPGVAKETMDYLLQLRNQNSTVQWLARLFGVSMSTPVSFTALSTLWATIASILGITVLYFIGARVIMRFLSYIWELARQLKFTTDCPSRADKTWRFTLCAFAMLLCGIPWLFAIISAWSVDQGGITTELYLWTIGNVIGGLACCVLTSFLMKRGSYTDDIPNDFLEPK